jgi:hypothetical protein
MRSLVWWGVAGFVFGPVLTLAGTVLMAVLMRNGEISRDEVNIWGLLFVSTIVAGALIFLIGVRKVAGRIDEYWRSVDSGKTESL